MELFDVLTCDVNFEEGMVPLAPKSPEASRRQRVLETFGQVK